jgi:CheY-like chemotaxis protein
MSESVWARNVPLVKTLLIVDDHDSYRSFLTTMLEGQTLTVCGSAEDGEKALEAVDELHPDLVLLDIQLPGIDGFAVADRIAQREEPPALTSTRDAEDFGHRLDDAPVLGFVPKHEMSVEALLRVLGRSGPAEA